MVADLIRVEVPELLGHLGRRLGQIGRPGDVHVSQGAFEQPAGACDGDAVLPSAASAVGSAAQTASTIAPPRPASVPPSRQPPLPSTHHAHADSSQPGFLHPPATRKPDISTWLRPDIAICFDRRVPRTCLGTWTVSGEGSTMRNRTPFDASSRSSIG